MVDTAEGASSLKLNRSVSRVARILKALAAGQPGLTLSEVSAAVNLPESTVYRLLATLHGEGFVERRADGTGRYQLGLELFRLGSAVLNRLGLGREIQPYLESLAEDSGETVNLGVLYGSHVLYLQKIESQHPLRASLTVGSASVPAYCSANGKTLLAHLPEDRLEQILHAYALERRGPNTITEREELRRELATIRCQGYAIDNQEFAANIRAVAAPIRDHHGDVIAAVAVAGPTARLPLKELQALAPRVISTANQISTQLGYVASKR